MTDIPNPHPHRLFIRTAVVITTLTLGLQLYAAVAATSDVLPSLAILGTSLLLSLIPLSFLHKKSLVYWLTLLFPIPLVILLMKFGGIYYGEVERVLLYGWPCVFILIAILNQRRFVSWQRKSFFILICLVIGGTGQCLYLHNQKCSWYGSWISLSVIQFGDIDGDGKTDLITSGYKGMAGGNPRWYRGNGKDFGGTMESLRCFNDEYLHCPSQLMVELNGDGKIDLINSGDIHLNEKGKFQGMPGLQNVDETGLFDMGWIKIPQRSLYFHADLDGDHIEEIFALIDGSLDFFYRENGVWKTQIFPAPALFDLCGKHLSISSDASAKLLNFLKSKPWPLRTCPLPPPVAGEEFHTSMWTYLEKHLIDLDDDGLDELAVCGTDEVKICRQKDGQFLEVSRVKHSNLNPMIDKDYFFWIEQFGDLNGDGRIDFLSQEGEVFLCDKDLQFHSAGKLPVRLPSRERDRCKLLLHDINGDGKLDVISSYQPWKSVILGPLVPNSKAKP